jgi:uncharacterized membrane protein YbhN (UPF0104 family)
MRKKEIKKYLKKISVIIIGLGTLIFFGIYIKNHPSLIGTITTIDPVSLMLLTMGYGLITLINAFVLFYSLEFIGKKTSILDDLVLTVYSSIVNFFGPLQSGPGFRAAYLKNKYSIKLRDFFVTTIIFYGFFAVINGLIIGLATFYKYKSLVLVGIIILVLFITSSVIILVYRRSIKVRSLVILMRIRSKNFWLIGVGAFLLTLATTGTYYVEIIHINSNISLTQTLIYTAAANLALFVSLTPGAIGFRESFLILSQQLHNIDTTTIIGASLIDRAFYVCFLAILFLILLVLKSRKHLRLFKD